MPADRAAASRTRQPRTRQLIEAQLAGYIDLAQGSVEATAPRAASA